MSASTHSLTIPSSNGVNGNGSTFSVIRSEDKSIISSDVLIADGELEFTIGADEVWLFKIDVVCDEAANNPDIKFRMGAFDGLTGSIEYDIFSSKNNQDQQLSDFVTESTSFTLTSAGKRTISIRGGITSIDAGILKLEWAQNVSDSDATTVYKNSTLVAIRG